MRCLLAALGLLRCLQLDGSNTHANRSFPTINEMFDSVYLSSISWRLLLPHQMLLYLFLTRFSLVQFFENMYFSVP